MKTIKTKPREVTLSSPPQHGFGLLETMLFLFVIGTLLVVGYTWLAAKKQAEFSAQTASELRQANQFIEAFAAVQFRLPCPAASPNGLEDCSLSKGFVPYKSMGFDASASQVGPGKLRFIINPLLTPAPTNAFEPRKWDGAPHAFMQVSSVDYCRRLTAAALSPAGAQVRNRAGVLRPVAYAIAHPGVLDADGDGIDVDGANVVATGMGATFEAPENGLNTGVYDDSVLSRTTVELAFNADCNVLTSTLDMMALGVDVSDEVVSARLFTTVLTGILGAVAIAKGAVVVIKTVMAGVALAGSVTVLSTATAELAAAIAGCLLAVGCLVIPHALAAVAAATAAVAAGGIAIALTAAALVPLTIFAAAALTISITAGVSLSQNIDLTDAISTARTTLSIAQANRIDANNRLASAQAAAATTNPAQSSALAALYNEANNASTGIVALTNSLGSPAGTAPLTALDGLIAAAVTAQIAVNEAYINESDARNALLTAQQSTPLDPAVVANKQTLLGNAIADVASSATAYANARQALIDASRREYCAPGCGLFYDGQVRITTAMDAYAAAADNAFLNAKRLLIAQQNAAAAARAEQEAQSALDQLLAANVTPVAGAATPVTVWRGAEAILRRADALGGTK